MGSKKKWSDKVSTSREGIFNVVATGFGFALIGAILDRGMGYLTRIILARAMTPSEYGLLFLAFSVLGIAITISVFGSNASTTMSCSF